MSADSASTQPRLFLLPGGRIGVSTRAAWVRTAWGALLYLVSASLVMRVAAGLGPKRLLHPIERLWGRAVRSFLDIRLDIRGVEHVDPGRSYVVLALHEGFADVLALLHLPLDLRFLARDELFEWPLLGRHLRATGQLIVPDRGRQGLRAVLRQGERLLASGESLVVFPQGSILGVETAFRPGVLRLVHRFGRPVLPVVITGSHRVWEYPFTPLLRAGRTVSLRVLPPRPAGSLDETSLRLLERHMKQTALSEHMAPVRRFTPTRDGYWDGYDYDIDPDFPELYREVAAHRAMVFGRPEAGRQVAD